MTKRRALTLINSLTALLVAGSFWSLNFYSFFFFDDPKGRASFPFYTLVLVGTVGGVVCFLNRGLAKKCTARHPYLSALGTIILYTYLSLLAFMVAATVFGYAIMSSEWGWLGLPLAPLVIFLYSSPVLAPIVLTLGLLFGFCLSRLHQYAPEGL